MSSRAAQCWKCGHETRCHQPAYGSPERMSQPGSTVGCSECNCLLTMKEKLRYWQVIA